MTSRPEWIDIEAARLFLEDGAVQFVDVRPPLKYQHSGKRIPGAIHADPGSGARLAEILLALPREKLIVTYCDEPQQAASAEAARKVRALGIGDGCALEGGFSAWQQAGFPVEIISARPGLLRSGPLGSHLLERTADGAMLQIRAPSLGGLVVEATLGLADALGVSGWALEPTEHVRVTRGRDLEALLLLWLIGLLDDSVTEQRLFTNIAILSVSEREVRARLRGAEVSSWLLEPRPPLMPEVHVERSARSFAATVILDRSLRYSTT